MMSILEDYPGMPGLFIAGIFSAALSSLSTCLNSMAAIVLEDFVKPYVEAPLNEKETIYIMRGTVLVIGIVSVALVFVVERLGTVLQLTFTLNSLAAGPLFGLFFMGIMCPWVKKRVNGLKYSTESIMKTNIYNRQGAFIAAITALLVMVWIVVYAQRDIATGDLQFAGKQSSTEECYYAFTADVKVTNSTLHDTKKK